MATDTLLPVPAVSAEVTAFAAEKGVAEYLPAVLEMTRRVFPQSRIKVAVEEDPELSYNTQIVILVEDLDWDVKHLLEKEHQWDGEFIKLCPKTLVHVFCMLIGNHF